MASRSIYRHTALLPARACEEIAASGNSFGIVTSDLWRSEDKDASGFKVARVLADKITRLRGRDAEVGRKMRARNRNPLT